MTEAQTCIELSMEENERVIDNDMEMDKLASLFAKFIEKYGNEFLEASQQNNQ